MSENWKDFRTNNASFKLRRKSKTEFEVFIDNKTTAFIFEPHAQHMIQRIAAWLRQENVCQITIVASVAEEIYLEMRFLQLGY